MQLIQDVKTIKNNKKDCSDREACRILIKTSEKKKATSTLYQNRSLRDTEARAKSLENQLIKARKMKIEDLLRKVGREFEYLQIVARAMPTKEK